MKLIIKGEEPDSFRQWKAQANVNWQPSWNDLANPQKHDLHTALLADHGYLCCYCGCKTLENESHIEHLAPRKRYAAIELDYANLLASC